MERQPLEDIFSEQQPAKQSLDDIFSVPDAPVAPTPEPVAQPESPSILDRMKQDYQSRTNNMDNIQKKYESGERGAPFGLLTTAGQLGGMISDPVAEAGKSAWSMMPDKVTKTVEGAGSEIANSPLGKKSISLIGNFTKNHPDITEGLGAAANIAGAIPAIGLGEKAISKVAVDPVIGAAEGIGNVAHGALARSPEALDLASNTMRSEAGKIYNAARAAGAVLTPVASNQVLSDISMAIRSSGKINKRLHGDTLDVLKDLAKEAKTGNLSLESLDQYRQLFREVTNKNFLTGKPDALKANQAIDAIDDAVAHFSGRDIASGDIKAVDLFNEGREKWTQYKKFETVSDVISKAGGDPNKLKKGLQSFVMNKKKMRGFTNDELKALKNAARQTTGESILKMFGKFGIDLGSPLSHGNAGLPGFLLGAGGLEGGQEGLTKMLPIVGAGTIARQGQKWVGRGKAEKALKIIEGKSNGGRIGFFKEKIK